MSESMKSKYWEVTVLLAVLALVGSEVRQKNVVNDVVRARQFVLVDQDGKERAIFGVNTNGVVSLNMLDLRGTNRVALMVGRFGAPVLSLFDENGSQVTRLLGGGLDLYDGGHLDLYDERGTNCVSLSSWRDGRLDLYNERGTECVSLSGDDIGGCLSLRDQRGTNRVLLSSWGGPSLDLYDQNGNARATLGVSKDGTSLDLLDENGKGCAALQVLKLGPGLGLSDENGTNRVFLSAHQKFGPALDLSDENGKTRATLGVTATETPDGKTINYPESTLTLFGPDSKVLRQLP